MAAYSHFFPVVRNHSGYWRRRPRTSRVLAYHAINSVPSMISLFGPWMGGIPEFAVLERLTDEEVIRRLTEVPGNGRWSVLMLLLFMLGRPNMLAAGELGIRKEFYRVYGMRRLPAKSTWNEARLAGPPIVTPPAGICGGLPVR